MQFTTGNSFKCPHCGAPIKIKSEDEAYSTCEYCGNTFKTPINLYLVLLFALIFILAIGVIAVIIKGF